MKNRLTGLQDHLFAQLERLSSVGLTREEIEQEAARAEAIVSVSDQVLKMAALQVQAAKIAQEAGADPVRYLPTPTIEAGDVALPANGKLHRPADGARLAPFPPFKGGHD